MYSPPSFTSMMTCQQAPTYDKHSILCGRAESVRRISSYTTNLPDHPPPVPRSPSIPLSDGVPAIQADNKVPVL